ncbi:hypothetical protein BO82DRAFT_106133 [Aspergillus uvarum CBS 121591]|uniref:Secreted protein n=1 Tax=Aspergillus uvarum CBS 121591 TaxID=1448315 RepID=A0A319CPH0_9EURO|nr:hypothetical protein BO82DRAFT_106133 [Aspergillus uvarum CBS 121591]PYH80643.1 hypothetical protein BO82DRAFT_106133 [Aspergillus uvarum CBS 121591]
MSVRFIAVALSYKAFAAVNVCHGCYVQCQAFRLRKQYLRKSEDYLFGCDGVKPMCTHFVSLTVMRFQLRGLGHTCSPTSNFATDLFSYLFIF